MLLSFEQIKSLTVGALEITERDGAIHFSRMTDSLKEAFRDADDRFYPRACCTTECRLEFHTDSRTLTLDIGAQCIEDNKLAKFEIFINNNPAYFYKQPGRETLCIPLPAGDTHVTVCMHCHNIGRLYSVELDDGAYIKPHRFDRKMLFLGDSITQGYNATHDALSYSYSLARYFNAESLNWAVSGSCFNESFLEKTAFDPDIIFVAYGTNDYRHCTSPEQLRSNCRSYLQKLKALYPGKQVFCISPIWRADGETALDAGTHRDCRRVIIEEILACGFTHIDGYDIFPHMTEFFQDEYLHPNDLGFALYTRNLIGILTPLL